MSPPVLLTLMSVFLMYIGFRAFVYFRSKRPHFGIAVVFVGAIVVFEMVRLIMKMATE
ncbi:MAG: hypothetical protein ACE37H_10590 [Phycisphaeraceae bacterium]